MMRIWLASVEGCRQEVKEVFPLDCFDRTGSILTAFLVAVESKLARRFNPTNN